MVIPGNDGHQKHRCSCDVPITPLDRTSSKESPVLQSGVPGASQPRNNPSGSLKHTLSSKKGRESLYALPIERAIGVINDLEQGSRKDSGLCPYHQERFSMVLRKMCREHKLLPSPYAITNELKRTGEFPSESGGNADVWSGLYQGSKVAIKVLRVYSRVDLANIEKSFYREAVLWKQLRHPNILPLVGATKSSDSLMMVSEWMENGTIMNFVTAYPQTNRLKLLADVARGLKYLHDWPSVHADLKSSNILIDSHFSARIADFGLTSVLRNHSMSISLTAPARGGTLRWMAPELFNDGSHPSKASDVYALGMVTYEVFAHERPFSRIPSLLVPGLVFAGQRPPRPPNREILGLSGDVWVLAEKCWDGNPTFRPHITDILSLFEAASCHWASSTSKAISNLSLDRPITIHESPTRETTFTTSEAMCGSDGTGSGDRNVVSNPHNACGLISSPVSSEQ